MKNLNKYKDYTIDDFVLDEDFHKLIKQKDSEHEIKILVEKFPTKKKDIQFAIHIIKSIHVSPINQDQKKIEKSWNAIKRTNKKTLRMPKQLRIAATILALVGLSSVLIYQITSHKLTKEIGIRSQQAELILSNGKTIEINSIQSTISYSPDGAGVTVNDTTQITQEISKKTDNQLIVPFGKQSFIELSDGTKVWLNSGSRLIFPAAFEGDKREVTLEGEGFFKVSKDKNHPFFVKTNRATLKVYGTEFNFQAYQIDQSYNIVLVEGSVSLMTTNKNNETFLIPSQKATIDTGKSEIQVKNIENTEIYTAWKDGYLTFIDEDVSEVLKRVSRYYNIKLSCDRHSKFDKIYGKLDLKNDFTKVIDGLAFISNANVVKRKEEYVFINKPK